MTQFNLATNHQSPINQEYSPKPTNLQWTISTTRVGILKTFQNEQFPFRNHNQYKWESGRHQRLSCQSWTCWYLSLSPTPKFKNSILPPFSRCAGCGGTAGGRGGRWGRLSGASAPGQSRLSYFFGARGGQSSPAPTRTRTSFPVRVKAVGEPIRSLRGLPPPNCLKGSDRILSMRGENLLRVTKDGGGGGEGPHAVRRWDSHPKLTNFYRFHITLQHREVTSSIMKNKLRNETILQTTNLPINGIILKVCYPRLRVYQNLSYVIIWFRVPTQHIPST